MTMNGAPTVFGAGLDSNNLLDVPRRTGAKQPGTIRVDRYSAAIRSSAFLVEQ